MVFWWFQGKYITLIILILDAKFTFVSSEVLEQMFKTDSFYFYDSILNNHVPLHNAKICASFITMNRLYCYHCSR